MQWHEPIFCLLSIKLKITIKLLKSNVFLKFFSRQQIFKNSSGLLECSDILLFSLVGNVKQGKEER